MARAFAKAAAKGFRPLLPSEATFELVSGYPTQKKWKSAVGTIVEERSFDLIVCGALTLLPVQEEDDDEDDEDDDDFTPVLSSILEEEEEEEEETHKLVAAYKNFEKVVKADGLVGWARSALWG